MPNIRIKDIPTTASATSSTDFIGIDGSANGTRKLDAYSPTFGGNLTVSGTGGLILSSSTPTVSSSATNASLIYTANGTGSHNFNNAINVNGVNGVGKLNARAETDGNLHTRAYSLINGSGTGVALDALNDANNSLTGFYIRGNAIKLGGGPVTITDNLTVSGIGTSSFAGTVNSNVGLRCTATNSNLSLYKDGTPSKAARVILNGSVADGLSFGLYNGTSWTDTLHISTNNNVLIGTTTDSGNGKIQLANHTTSAGGIGFGTDTSLYRESTGTVVISSTGTAPTFRLAESGTFKVQLASVSGTGYLDANQSLILRTNGSTTALTLTSTQAAQFAGSLAIKNASDLQFAYPSDSSVATGRIGWWNGSGIGVTIGQPSANVLTLNTSGATALTLDSSQRCILAGALRLNNAYTASAVVPTGYVTIQDSTGTTYKVCVLL